MSIFQIFDRLTRWLSAAALLLVVCFFVAMVTLNGAEAIGRYVFKSSSIYFVESSVFLGSVVYFLGYAVLLKNDEDIRMGYFIERMPRRIARIVDVATECGVVVFFAVMIKASWGYFELTALIPHSLFPFAQGYVVLPLLVGAVAGFWIALHRLCLSIRALFAA